MLPNELRLQDRHPKGQSLTMKFYIHVFGIAVGLCFVQASFAQDPAKQSPDKYKAIFNNDKVRVLDVHLKPGDKSPMHSHPNYIVYSFTNGSVKFTFKDGKTADVKTKAGQCMWRDAESHAVENTGKTEVHVLNIELKH
jgi:mannose-6-phosphate isomerase-like protein (cupin superfamily)